MIPILTTLNVLLASEPRMRGDDPVRWDAVTNIVEVSPACAGMIPVWDEGVANQLREPRMRGDDPMIGETIVADY